MKKLNVYTSKKDASVTGVQIAYEDGISTLECSDGTTKTIKPATLSRWWKLTGETTNEPVEEVKEEKVTETEAPVETEKPTPKEKEVKPEPKPKAPSLIDKVKAIVENMENVEMGTGYNHDLIVVNGIRAALVTGRSLFMKQAKAESLELKHITKSYNHPFKAKLDLTCEADQTTEDLIKVILGKL